VFSTAPDSLTNTYWAAQGSSLEETEKGIRLTTPAAPFHYAAWAPLDLSGLNLDSDHGWLEIDLSDLAGEIGIGLYDESANALHAEAFMRDRSGDFTHRIDLHALRGNHLLFRTGPAGFSGTVTFRGARLLTTPKVV